MAYTAQGLAPVEEIRPVAGAVVNHWCSGRTVLVPPVWPYALDVVVDVLRFLYCRGVIQLAECQTLDLDVEGSTPSTPFYESMYKVP